MPNIDDYKKLAVKLHFESIREPNEEKSSLLEDAADAVYRLRKLLETGDEAKAAEVKAARQVLINTTNAKVIDAFLNRQPAKAGNLVSDGERLLSYGYYELAKWVGNEVVLRFGALYSNTTLKHFRLLERRITHSGVRHRKSETETPFDEANMN